VLVHDLLHDFLFPASKTMMDSMNGGTSDLLLSEFNPKYDFTIIICSLLISLFEQKSCLCCHRRKEIVITLHLKHAHA